MPSFRNLIFPTQLGKTYAYGEGHVFFHLGTGTNSLPADSDGGLVTPSKTPYSH
jgi:hypothetical protein